jgi:carbonic anhydrase
MTRADHTTHEWNGTTMTRMTPLLVRNEEFARTYTPAPLGPPAAQLLLLTCLDHRVDPGFRRRVTEATGVPEATLEAAAVADPHTTVKADVERLLASPLLSSKVSVSGHVYDIATGHLTTTVDGRDRGH